MKSAVSIRETYFSNTFYADETASVWGINYEQNNFF